MILSLNTYPSFCYTVSDCLPAAIVVMPPQQQSAASSSSAQGSASKAPLTRSLSHVLSASVSRELSLHAASAGPAASTGVTSPAASSAGLLSLFVSLSDPHPSYVML